VPIGIAASTGCVAVSSRRDSGTREEFAATRASWESVTYAETPFLGDNLLPLLVLALGGALLVGNVMALVKPPPRPKEGELRRAPTGRSLLMALIGLVAAVWALGSLVS